MPYLLHTSSGLCYAQLRAGRVSNSNMVGITDGMGSVVLRASDQHHLNDKMAPNPLKGTVPLSYYHCRRFNYLSGHPIGRLATNRGNFGSIDLCHPKNQTLM